MTLRLNAIRQSGKEKKKDLPGDSLFLEGAVSVWHSLEMGGKGGETTCPTESGQEKGASIRTGPSVVT